MIHWINAGHKQRTRTASSSSWRDTYSLRGGKARRPIQQCKYNKCIVLRRGDAGSRDFPPLAPIIASSIRDVSGSDRRCLITTSLLLHGRQIGSTCWIRALSSFCRPGSLSSFDTAWRILPLKPTLALFVFFFPLFFFLLQRVGPMSCWGGSVRYLAAANLGSPALPLL